MDKEPAGAASDGLPSMQFDGRRLLSDPDVARHVHDTDAPGLRRLQIVEHVNLFTRLAAMAGLSGLLLLAWLGWASVFDWPRQPQILWAGGAFAVAALGLISWMLAPRYPVTPFNARRRRLLMAAWTLLAAGLVGAAVGPLVGEGWTPQAPWTLFGVAVLTALVIAAAACWLPALIVTWTALVAAQWWSLPETMSAMWRVPLLGFDLALFAIGLALSGVTALGIRRLVTERMTRRELAELKARVSDQSERLSSEDDQRRSMEQALAEARSAADVANRAKTEFLATMSHEVRTPLNGILPILEMLRESRLDDMQREFLETAYTSSRHLLRIINDVLDFAKAESGKLELESIEIDVRELVESVTDLMSRGAMQRGLVLTYKVDDEVPQRVRGDSIRLRQVLSNLVSNAIKFTKKGRIQVEVHKRRTSRKEVELVFSVADTGIGMSRDTQRRLFRPFSQADASTTRTHGGTGLGLVICKRLVELMGGRITVKSQPDEGSVFSFVLPMRRSAGEVPPARRDLAGLRVITLVDDIDAADRLSDALRSWGLVEEQVDSAVTAVSRIKSGAQLGRSWGFDLFIASLSAGRQTFVSLVDDLRSSDALQDLKIVLGTGTPSLLPELQKLPGVVAMEAPLDLRTLQRHLHRMFDVAGHRSREEPDTEALYDSLVLDFESMGEMDPVPHPVVRGDVIATALLVEDNPVNLSVARRMLAKLGIAAEIARNGREALEVLADRPVDLVMMDCQMPELDGYEATRRIRQDEERADPPRHMPIIAMTANVMTGDREKCLSAGMDDYLGKPLEFNALRRALEPWVRLNRSQRRHSEALHVNLPEQDHAGARDPVAPAGLDDVADAKPAPSARPAPGPEVALDQDRLAGLHELMGDELPVLIRQYLSTAPRLVAELKRAGDADDIRAMIAPAHSLKSSSANMAALRLARQAEALEHAARKGDVEKARRVHHKVLKHYKLASAALTALLDGGALQHVRGEVGQS